MMRNILVDLRLPFESAADREGSEIFLIWFLGILCHRNFRYLKEHPETPLLYESGVQYALPDQISETRVRPDKLQGLAKYLRSIGADDETIVTVIRYVKGIEVFRDIPTLFKRKHGDCDNLTCARVPELWRAGIMASPFLIDFPNDRGGTTYHAVVQHPDKSIEDPSLILGMGGAERLADRAEEIRKNNERRDNLLAAGAVLVDQGASTTAIGKYIDMCGFVPRGGFR